MFNLVTVKNPLGLKVQLLWKKCKFDSLLILKQNPSKAILSDPEDKTWVAGAEQFVWTPVGVQISQIIWSLSLLFTSTHIVYSVGRNSAVSIATGYALDGPAIESRWGRDFSHWSWPAVVPTQPPVWWVPGLFPRVKRPGRGVAYAPHLAPRLKREWSCTSTPSLVLHGLL